MRNVLASIALVAASASASAAPAKHLRFIEDDWPRALAEAKARDLPLFVDAWAPW